MASCPFLAGEEREQFLRMHVKEPGEAAAIASLYGCFSKLVILFVGVFTKRTLLFGIKIGAPDHWKLPSDELWSKLLMSSLVAHEQESDTTCKPLVSFFGHGSHRYP